jgi:hypothetical protein
MTLMIALRNCFAKAPKKAQWWRSLQLKRYTKDLVWFVATHLPLWKGLFWVVTNNRSVLREATSVLSDEYNFFYFSFIYRTLVTFAFFSLPLIKSNNITVSQVINQRTALHVKGQCVRQSIFYVVIDLSTERSTRACRQIQTLKHWLVILNKRCNKRHWHIRKANCENGY